MSLNSHFNLLSQIQAIELVFSIQISKACISQQNYVSEKNGLAQPIWILLPKVTLTATVLWVQEWATS